MPIKFLTNGPARFPQIGVLRKGGQKQNGRWGRDLDYFRFTSDIPGVVEKFTACSGDRPQAVNVFLPYVTTAENFQTWKEEFSAGGLVHRCDGEYVVRYQKNGRYIDPEYGTLPCPYESGQRERTKEHPGCTNNGRLSVIIPELGELAYVIALTKSINDIVEIHANLAAYEALRGDLRGIPFVLSRVPRMISTPSGNDGKRVRREKWLLHIKALPEWVNDQLTTMRHKALPSAAAVNAAADDYVEGEIVEPESEPDSVMTDKQRKQFRALGRDLYGPAWDEKRAELVERVTKGRTTSSKNLMQDEADRLIDGMAEKLMIERGKGEYDDARKEEE